VSDFKDFNAQMSVPIGAAALHSRCHIAVIGGSGTGKTTWACKASDVLVVLTEPQAAERIRASNPEARVVLVSDVDQIKSCTDWLSQEVFAPSNDGWKPQAIVLDSVTEMCRMLGDRIDAALGGGDWGYRQWKRYKDGCLRMVRGFRNLPANVVGLFLDDVVRAEGGSTGGRRMSTGMSSMAPHMASLFNLCFWTIVQNRSADEVVYAVRTAGGVYNGCELEQGKGDPAMALWINPATVSPTDVVNAVSSTTKPESETTEPETDNDNNTDTETN